jgi:two-component system sensor histidine kinase/response regulator
MNRITPNFPPAKPAKTTPPLVLAADDEDANLDLLVRLFEPLGWEVVTANNGQEALWKLERKLPDLILLDVMMPGLDGYEVCRQIQKKEEWKRIPVIFLTARRDPADMLEGFEVGGVDYVAKPFHPQELLARVKMHLEMRRQQEELAQAYATLKTINANQSRIFTIIAHDLRNPFNGLKMFPQLLKMQYDRMTKEEVMALASDLEQEVSRVHGFLGDLLNWSILQMEQVSVQPSHVNLHDAVGAALSLAYTSTRAKEQVVENQVPKDARIFVDPQVLNTVLRNLISNAVKFTPRGGSITVSARQSASQTEITVEDNGVGIPAQRLEHLFEPQHRQRNLGTEEETGSGLGLIICHELVERHGGRIWVESALGKGSAFHVSFPRR